MALRTDTAAAFAKVDILGGCRASKRAGDNGMLRSDQNTQAALGRVGFETQANKGKEEETQGWDEAGYFI